jgi:hypothetical protein
MTDATVIAVEEVRSVVLEVRMNHGPRTVGVDHECWRQAVLREIVDDLVWMAFARLFVTDRTGTLLNVPEHFSIAHIGFGS